MSLRTLYQTLLDSDIGRLRVIALQWKISLTADRRPDMAAELADAMAREKAVESALGLLRDDERAALDDILRHGGVLPKAVFVRRWGEIRPVGPGRLEREALWRDPVSAAEGLWYSGLIQRAFQARPTGQTEVVFVPEELRLYMPEPAPVPWVLPAPAEPPAYQIAGTDVLADDLVTLLAAAQATSLEPEAGDVRAEFAAQMAPAEFDCPADVRFAFLKTLALEQGWLREDEDGRLRPVPEPMLAWLQAAGWEQWASLAQAWIDSPGWNDLSHVPSLRPDAVHGWPNVALAGRQAFLDVLRHCQPGAWYAIPDFVDFVRENALDFLRPDGDYEAWALRGLDDETPLRGVEAWGAVEGMLVVYFLTGPLLWLGLVDVGAEMPQAFIPAFRLSTAGLALLGLGDPPVLPERTPLHLRDDGVVLAPPRRRYARFQLRRIAQPEGWADGYRYRLTPSSLVLARRQRISVKRIAGFLREMSGRAVPSHLRAAIERAYRGEDTARLARVWLLRVADPADLEQQSLQPFVRERLGADTALIREEDREKVLAMLARSGILADVLF